MTKQLAYQLLDLREGADQLQIQKAYQKLYNDWQIRITNAPTTQLKETYLAKFEELKQAYALLYDGEVSEDYAFLPANEPFQNEIQNNENTKVYSADELKEYFGLSDKFTLEELEIEIKRKKEPLQKALNDTPLEEAKAVYQKKIEELESSFNILKPLATIPRVTLSNAYEILDLSENFTESDLNQNYKRFQTDFQRLLSESPLVETKAIYEERLDDITAAYELLKPKAKVVPVATAKQPTNKVQDKPTDATIKKENEVEPTEPKLKQTSLKKEHEATRNRRILPFVLGVAGLLTIVVVALVLSNGSGKGKMVSNASSKTNTGNTEDNDQQNLGIVDEEKDQKETEIQKEEQKESNASSKKVNWRDKYDKVGRFYEGVATVKLDDKWGYLDETGKLVIPLIYDAAYRFSEGLGIVKLNGKYGYIDKTGKVIIPLQYDDAYEHQEGKAVVVLNGKLGHIDKKGNIITSIQYDWVDAFADGIARVKLNKKYGLIDKTGKELTTIKYDFIDRYVNTYIGYDEYGRAKVKLNSKWGFLDRRGNEIGSLKYSHAEDFLSGLAAVELNGKWGFIDVTGKEVIPIKYDYVSGFIFTTYSYVNLDGEEFKIDREGNRIE